MNEMAMAVALLVCGDALFALHVASVGAATYAPEMEKNNEAYWMWCFDDARNIVKPIIEEKEDKIATKPRQW